MTKRYYTPKWSKRVYDKESTLVIACATMNDAVTLCKLLNNYEEQLK